MNRYQVSNSIHNLIINFIILSGPLNYNYNLVHINLIIFLTHIYIINVNPSLFFLYICYHCLML